MKSPKSPKKIGIFGSGQLARFLCVEAKKLGFETAVMAHTKLDPASLVADSVFVASKSGAFESDELVKFCEGVDLGIFENEFLPEAAFKALESRCGIPVLPTISAMRVCSDKSRQKEFLKEMSIPTARFEIFESDADPAVSIKSLGTRFSDAYILKWAKGGYDGYGVKFVDPSQLSDPKVYESVISFFSLCLKSGARIYAEELVKFESEMALVAVRSASGEMAFYPLVQTIQEEGICRVVRGPIDNDGLTKQANGIAQSLAERLELVGTFAIEFFATKDGLMVNEVAPRVHNSGHCTLDSSETNQFKNHILAVCGLPLESTQSVESYAMVNILGPVNVEGPVKPPRVAEEEAKLYWYEKAQSRPGRKMGHLNLFGKDAEKIKHLEDKYLAEIRAWENSKPEDLNNGE